MKVAQLAEILAKLPPDAEVGMDQSGKVGVAEPNCVFFAPHFGKVMLAKTPNVKLARRLLPPGDVIFAPEE